MFLKHCEQLAKCFSFRVFNTIKECVFQLALLNFWLEVLFCCVRMMGDRIWLMTAGALLISRLYIWTAFVLHKKKFLPAEKQWASLKITKV